MRPTKNNISHTPNAILSENIHPKHRHIKYTIPIVSPIDTANNPNKIANNINIFPIYIPPCLSN